MKKVYALIGFLLILIIAISLFFDTPENGNPEVKAEKDKPRESQDIIDGIIKEKEKEVELIAENYKDIIKLIQAYKFPTDGVVSEDRNMVSYENGYSLFKVGMGYSITYEPEIGPAAPTKEQYLPIIVGIIHSTHNKEAHEWEDFNAINQYIEDTMKQLNQAKAYSEEYPSLLDWLDETIGYLEKAKKLVPNEEAKELFRRALTNIDNFIEAKEIAEE